MSVEGVTQDPRAPHGVLISRELIERLLEGCQIVDREYRYLDVNDAALQQLRRSRDELLGRTMMECYPGVETTPMFERLSRCMLVREQGGVVDEVALPEGGRAVLELRFVPIDGGVCILSLDVTDRRDASRELARTREALQTANRELETFSHSIAHDLRAPLRGIDGFSQALVEEYGDRLDDTGREYLCYVRESAQRMARLIDALLSLSRVSRATLRPEIVDLSPISMQVLQRLARVDPTRIVRTKVEPTMQARGDVRLLEVVMTHLLENAWKFTRRRHEAHVEVGTCIVDGARAYYVRDDGAGFDMTHASKLFGLFRRMHSMEEFDGTGVGLATVQRIVERHGGRVWAEAAVDRGATFRFTLGNGDTER